MSLTLGRNENVRAAIKRVSRKRIDNVIELLDSTAQGGAGPAIHAARRQLKQLRALLRLMHPQVGAKQHRRADRRLREVSRLLAPLRDASVLAATLTALQREAAIPSGSFAAIRAVVRTRMKRAREQAPSTGRQRKRLIGSLLCVRRQLAGWSSIRPGWKAIDAGLRHIYREGRAAILASDGSDIALHEARKRTKALFYALEFLEQAQPRLMRAKIAAAQRLADCLGDDHDLAVLDPALGKAFPHT